MGDADRPVPHSASKIYEAADGAGLDALFRRYGTAIRRFVFGHLINSDDSDDVVQDAFLGVWRRMREGSIGADARAYLFQSAANAARDKNRHRRLNSGRISAPISVEILDRTLSSADDEYYWREGLTSIEKALGELNPSVRSVFVFYHLEGLSVPAIAKRINKSTRTVERHLATALAHCADRVKTFLEPNETV